MAGGRPLVPVEEPAADGASSFRAQGDSTWVRYQKMPSGFTYSWRALATDGSTFYFGDTDSHTSVILAQLILRERFNVSPPLLPLSAARTAADLPEAMLLIGDKVVNAAPDAAAYPHQLDLGEQWKLLTGLPFVFAMWMIRQDAAATEGPACTQSIIRSLSIFAPAGQGERNKTCSGGLQTDSHRAPQ